MELVNRRRRAVAALQTELARVYGALCATGAKVEIRYQTALGEASDAAALLAALERAQREEVRRGQTLVGPHRDDLTIEIDGVDARAYGSRGQQRLVALALRLAEMLPVTDAAGAAPGLLLHGPPPALHPAPPQPDVPEPAAAAEGFLHVPEDPDAIGRAGLSRDAGRGC